MKLWNLIPLAFLFSLQVSAKSAFTEDQYLMLSPTEFSNLTHAEQRAYIKELRKIFVEMNEINPQTAADFQKRTGILDLAFSMSLPTATAAAANESTFRESSRPIAIDSHLEQADKYSAKVAELLAKDPKSLTKEDQKVLESNFEMSARYVKGASYFVNNEFAGYLDANQRKVVNDTTLKKSRDVVDANYEKIKAAFPDSSAAKSWDEIKKGLDKGLVPEGEKAFGDSLVEFGQPLKISSSGKIASAPRAQGSLEKVTSSKLNEAKPTEKKQIGTTKEGKSKVVVGEEKTVGVYYRCMYSGFVLKTADCEGSRKLPQDWLVDGLNGQKHPDSFIPKSFECDEGQTMCNPFVFGVKVTCNWKKSVEKDRTETACMSTSKPYCVKDKNRNATSDCDSISNNDTAVESAIYLYKKNPELGADFNKSFTELCYGGTEYLNKRSTSARARKDINETCKVARVRLLKIKNMYSVKDSKTKKSSETPTKADALTAPGHR